MRLPLLALTFAITASAAAQTAPSAEPATPPALKAAVTFTCGLAKKGTTALTAATVESDTTVGWDLGTAPTVADGTCSSAKPFFFSIPISEGNYRVTVTLGGKQESVATVRAEARRLMIEKLPVAANKTVTKSFDVNVRVPEFTKPDGTPGRVRLKSREIGNLDWDPKLTIEFNGTNPSFRSITIEALTGDKAEPVIYLAGDSTMVDQDVEPWASWGQMFPRFFTPTMVPLNPAEPDLIRLGGGASRGIAANLGGIVIANHAESGESSASFVGEQRFAKIMSLIKPGDWFFVQFAHNDQKLGPDFPERYRKIMTDFVTQVKAKGATPVLVTSMNRETFDADGHIKDSLAPYPQITREIAQATNTALIDLNAMSKMMFEAMGKDGADHAFMKFKAGSYPGVERDISDTTHFNNYGAYELARCIVHGIREDKLPVVKFLDSSVPDFNPAQPDTFASFSLPYTPMQKKEDATQIPQANLK
jgi:lysophospholipase L1-like esterase